VRDEIGGYSLEAELHQGPSSRVYRGRRESDNHPVVLKVLKNDFPSAHELARYEREFKVASRLKLARSVRVLAITRAGHRSVIVYEDDASVSLRRMYGGRMQEAGTVLSVTEGLARALVELHSAKLMHNDISPANILIHPQTHAIKLTDFELAAPLRGDDEAAPQRAIGTLAYMAPEQSGRTSQKPDFRSDLYSVGATLFEIAAGRPVFSGLDDAGLLHAHFAVAPPSVREFNPHIPEILEAVILKLLAKAPADRYQSAQGLLDDIERMRLQWNSEAHLDTFVLGRSDHPMHHTQSERLYGRDGLLATLATAIAETVGKRRPQWISLHGGAGCGKSSVVKAFAEQLPSNHVLSAGRAERLQQSSPYAALIEAFSVLVRHWLALPEAQLVALRSQVRMALGVNAGVLEPLIPELPKLIGPSVRLLPLGASAEQTRFQLAVRAFLQVAAIEQAPLILFIDDLQWADAATLTFLEKLLTSDLEDCVLITCERSNTGATLLDWRQRLRAADIGERVFELPPLSQSQIAQLIDDNFGELSGGAVARDALVNVLFEKTLGNPFFVRQCIRVLMNTDALNLDMTESARRWKFDPERARKLDLSDNVLALLGERVASLPAEQRTLLEHAACIGQQFDLAMLAQLLPQFSAGELRSELQELVELAMLAPISGENGGAGAYKFVHERICETALGLHTEQDRASVHWQIGEAWQRSGERGLFEIVGQLNRGLASVDDDKKREQLAILNAEAARVARAQTAYDAALEYAGYAVTLMPPVGQQNPEQILDLHMLLADCQASAGQLDAAVQVFDQALTLATTPDARIQVLERLADALQSSGQPALALVQVQRALEKIGQPLPTPGANDVRATDEMDAERTSLFKELSDHKTLKVFATLPDADQAAARVGRLYDKAIISVYFTRPELLGFVTARAVQHVLKTGLTPEAGLAIAWWSMVLCMQDKHALASHYAALAREIHQHFGNDYYGGGGRMVATAMALSWTRPYAENFAEAGESAALLHQSGNLQFASYSLITQHIITIVEAADCHAMLQSCERWGEYCERYVPLELGQAQIRAYCIRRMMGQNPDVLDCDAIVEQYAQQNNATDVCESLTEMARFALITGDFKTALAYSERAHPLFTAGAAGTLLLNFLHLVILAIASARIAKDAGDDERDRLQKQHDLCAQRVGMLSALHPVNFDAYQRLVAAEGARMRGQASIAISEYFAAIGHAQQHGYTLLQAQATQYLGELLRAQGHEFAVGLERDAEQLYQRAGCMIMVRDSENRSVSSTASAISTRGSTPSTGPRGVDIASVMKASDAIASEIDYDKLLRRLLDITVENAGAQRGVLVLQEKGKFNVVAETGTGNVLEPLEESKRCPAQMLTYVARSGNATSLENGPRRSAFREEPYFVVNAVRSVLACPILRKGELRGVLYLENNVVTGAFDHQRLETINMILGSAAIALENAELYREQKQYTGQLEARVRERTVELEQANAILSRLADLDGLTQLANRRSFDRECQRLASTHAPAALILCDVDDFKAYNDRYGHPAGDDVLRRVAAAMNDLPKSVPVTLARYGGEEFALLMHTADRALALDVAERIKHAVEALNIPHDRARAAQHVTMSLGIAVAHELSSSRIAALIAEADTALYLAKSQGRNRAVASTL
jgi:histidine kinase